MNKSLYKDLNRKVRELEESEIDYRALVDNIEVEGIAFRIRGRSNRLNAATRRFFYRPGPFPPPGRHQGLIPWHLVSAPLGLRAECRADSLLCFNWRSTSEDPEREKSVRNLCPGRVD